MDKVSVRKAVPGDLDAVKVIAVAVSMFSSEEVDFFDDMFGGWLDGSLENHEWIVAEKQDGSVVAIANYAPEPFADRMWNLYFIAVDPPSQAHGFGSQLMAHVEQHLTSLGEDQARVLVVETSSTDQYKLARQFYRKIGYIEEARIREFYGPADDKVVFWKSLIATT